MRSAGLELLQQRAIATIGPLVATDAHDRVRRTVAQYNRAVRGQIREETGLSLADENGRGNVPIRVEDGFPAGVAKLINNHPDPILWRLIMLRPALEDGVDGLNALLEHREEIEVWPHSPMNSEDYDSCAKSGYDLITLLHHSNMDIILGELREIHEDILGIYRFYPSPPRIEIYWMAHALFAAAFDVRVEDLTVMTLAHELAHAYTHLGRDIDGAAWRDPGFGQSDRNVLEGLAQHFTAVVTENLGTSAPGAYASYLKLLSYQSGPYRTHESWFPNSSAGRSEMVRFALLRARNRGKVTDPEWREMLEQARRDLTNL